jgi:dUTP pyrophosphatase
MEIQTPYLKFKKEDKRAIIPSKRLEDAGYDFYMVEDYDFKILEIGDIYFAPTKLKCEFSQDWVLMVFERGSTGSKGISRRCGVIDSGYRGEIFIVLNNTSDKKIIFYQNENEIDNFLITNNLKKEEVILYPKSKAVAQGILMYSPHIEVEEVENLSSSLRGEGSLGSSGK